jgi:hypothetical protein
MSILVSMECMLVSDLLRHLARLRQDGRLHRQLLNMSILGSMECIPRITQHKANIRGGGKTVHVISKYLFRSLL